MHKQLWKMVAFLLVFVLLTACGSGSEEDTASETDAEQSESNQTSEQNEDTVKITLTKDQGEEYIHEKEIPVEEGENLLEVLKDNFYVETDGSGQFITSIERVSSEDDEERAWIYTVNGERVNVGAADYELQAGDEVVFDFQKWE
ncbi:DUF4430 domain-containing protein [Oceanobacillus manasiensis]|uniref:DUF4430 domain-containing protein n=1 Tax=Oceanobacillus manasiensis TaxID=586413 RepID=UPI0005A6468A|nr:DUF4430 domain-containing protein [Oceanobacillus manasiensis]